MTDLLSSYTFVEGTVLSEWGTRHLIVMAKLDDAADAGWSWVTYPVVMRGETFVYRENDVADWAETMRRHGVRP